MPSDQTLDTLRDRLRAFAEARQWTRFHTPKNLAMALAGEVGELVAELQWLTEEESSGLTTAGDRRDRLVDEVADAAIYLLRFCDVLDIDLLEVVAQRIDRNEQRFPPERVSGRALRSRDMRSPGVPG
ncbi:nucleotide pyrophosphohydrolase [Geodermatophilus sp. SYSU D00697]